MVGVDFNSFITFSQYTFTDSLKGLADAHRTDCFLTTDGLSSKEAIRQIRSPISRQLSSKNFFLFRSVSVYGVRSDNISTEPSRHRDLPKGDATKTLPLWYTRKNLTNHFGQSKRKPRLENLCRFRPGADREGAKALRQRRFRHSAKTHRLCSRFDHHRFMSIAVSMGKISQAQSRGQGSHANGPERLYTLVYPHYRRKRARCKYPRRSCFRAGCNLHNGSWLPRLRSSLYLYSKPFHFYYQSQKQFGLSPSLLSQGRQNHRFAMRPNNKTQWLLCVTGLSCSTSSNRLLRHRYKEKIRIPNKQLLATGINSCSTLQMSLADRNLLQMDQAIPSNQNIFRRHRECGKNPNLDCHQRLRSCSDSQERTPNRAESKRNLANTQHYAFRTSAYATNTYKNYIAKSKPWVS